MNGINIKQFFDTHYPQTLAYEWDNVGLQVGTLNKPITGILLTLDVTKEVLKEAIKQDCNLIISHHPLIFKPLNHILTDVYKGQLIETLIKQDIALYTAHTNYDLGHKGMNHVLAGKLGLTNTEILDYETEHHGIGQIGEITPQPLAAIIETIKTKLDMPNARLITNKTKDTLIKKIAISGGSGADHMFKAKQKGADLYITGDISYHQAHDMLQMGLSTLDIGHYAEKHFKTGLKTHMETNGIAVPIHVSKLNLDPFEYV